VQTLATLQEAFLARRLAILPVSARTPGPLQSGIDAGLVDASLYDLFPVAYPSAPGLDPQAYSESSWFGIWWKPDRARMDAAAELGAFLSSSENQQYVTATRSFPVRGALAEPYDDPILTFMQEGTKFAAADPLKPPYFAIGAVVADLVAGVLTGAPNTNPTPAMDAAVERGQQAVDAYWEALGI